MTAWLAQFADAIKRREEREEIKAAMKAEGIRSMADFLRYAALKLARS